MLRVVRRLLPAVSGALLTAVVGLSSASAASASSLTWTGGSLWSAGSSWSDGGVTGTAPANGDSLTFPDLPSCDALQGSARSSCYSSTDDLGPLTLGSLSIDGDPGYQLYPSGSAALTLDGAGGTTNVGLTASYAGPDSAFSVISIPIVLGADQEWDIGSSPRATETLYLTNVSGPHRLTLNLSSGTQLVNYGNLQVSNLNTGAVTLTGNGTLQLDGTAGASQLLAPAASAGVTVDGTASLIVSAPNATSGPITFQGTGNFLNVISTGTNEAPPGPSAETILTVNGPVTLNAATNMEFDIDGNSTTPGVDSSQLTTTGAVSLNGATVSLWQADDGTSCDSLTPGTTFTLLRAGSISGTMTMTTGTQISQGGSAVEPIVNDCTVSGYGSPSAVVTYGANTITATIAGPPAAGAQAPAISGTPVVGHRLTVSGNGSWTGAPAPSLTYQWRACTAAGTCSKITGATGSSFTLTSAQAGENVRVRVTATNSYGSATADSGALGPVTTPAGPTAATPITTASGAKQSATTATQIRSALRGLGHPAGRRAILALLRGGVFRTRFQAPAAGVLRVTWTKTITTGRGRHRRHRTITVATGSARAGGPRTIQLRVHLTGAGRLLLRAGDRGLVTTATERFRPAGGRWTTVRKRFRL